MAMHVYKLEPFQNGTYWYCNDPAICGKKGPKWHIPARLLGLEMDKYLSLLVALFDAEILGWNGETLVYGFKTSGAAEKWCKYINSKAKQICFCI